MANKTSKQGHDDSVSQANVTCDRKVRQTDRLQSLTWTGHQDPHAVAVLQLYSNVLCAQSLCYILR